MSQRGNQTSSVPTTDVEVPEHSGSRPDTDVEVPEHSGSRPDTDVEVPEHSGSRPDTDVEVPEHSGSRLTRVVGGLGLFFMAMTLAFGLVFSGPEVAMRDSVRLLYIHVPSVLVAYGCFGVTLIGSVIYLRNQSRFWDLMAYAAAEVGVVYVAFTLITGSLWGRPTWGTYWDWDPRLTSTALMFLMYVGYLALRRLDMPADVRSRRAAVLGIISILNVVVVHYSVAWWRGLHQAQTFGIDTQLDGLMLFSAFMGLLAMGFIAAWLVIHRFRIGWMETELGQLRLQNALIERRREGSDRVLAEEAG